MSEFFLKIRLEDWINNSEEIIEKLKIISGRLKRFRSACLVALIIGSTVFIVSVGGLIGGVIENSLIALGAAIAGNISNCITILCGWLYTKTSIDKVKSIVSDNQKNLFEFTSTFLPLLGSFVSFNEYFEKAKKQYRKIENINSFFNLSDVFTGISNIEKLVRCQIDEIRQYLNNFLASRLPDVRKSMPKIDQAPNPTFVPIRKQPPTFLSKIMFGAKNMMKLFLF